MNGGQARHTDWRTKHDRKWVRKWLTGVGYVLHYKKSSLSFCAKLSYDLNVPQILFF
jgi:hypothetical protein